MATAERHRWQFAARFRRNAFGWRSQPAIARVHEAVAEIRKVRRSNAVLAAEGAVLFLEKVSPALEHVDSSSGAIGNAVNRAIEELVPVIATAPADLARRSVWLERLWEAYTADQIPYIETLGDFWGELCASRELASVWADALLDGLQENWERRATRRLFPRHGGLPLIAAGGGTIPGTLGAARQSAVHLVERPALGSPGLGGNGKAGRGDRLCRGFART